MKMGLSLLRLRGFGARLANDREKATVKNEMNSEKII
jgi:hypothetical protein